MAKIPSIYLLKLGKEYLDLSDLLECIYSHVDPHKNNMYLNQMPKYIYQNI